MTEQEAFDEAFNGIASDFALDDLIDKLAAVGLTVLPWQRNILATWVDSQSLDTPLSVRVLRLSRELRVSSPNGQSIHELSKRSWQERCWDYIQDIHEGGGLLPGVGD